MYDSNKVNVVIFDDHSFVTDALNSYLGAKDEINVLGAFNDKDALLYSLSILEKVDLLVADVLTDEDIGLIIFEQVRINYPSIIIVVYSSITSEFLKSSLMAYGVSAIINKKETFDKVYQEILKIELGASKKYKAGNLPKLTPKEKVIVNFLAEGLASKQIADMTNSSVNTINNQKNALLEKFNCGNSTDLIVKLTQLGMLTIV